MHFTNKPWRELKWALMGYVLLTSQMAQSQTPLNAATDQEIRLPYQSQLEGYQRYTSSKIETWRKSNQTVEQIGGWKAYAKDGVTTPTSSNEAQPQQHQMHHEMGMKHEHGGQR
jgi:hypothetical protein